MQKECVLRRLKGIDTRDKPLPKRIGESNLEGHGKPSTGSGPLVVDGGVPGGGGGGYRRVLRGLPRMGALVDVVGIVAAKIKITTDNIITAHST